jgi:hypothetical protein
MVGCINTVLVKRRPKLGCNVGRDLYCPYFLGIRYVPVPFLSLARLLSLEGKPQFSSSRNKGSKFFFWGHFSGRSLDWVCPERTAQQLGVALRFRITVVPPNPRCMPSSYHHPQSLPSPTSSCALQTEDPLPHNLSVPCFYGLTLLIVPRQNRIVLGMPLYTNPRF